MIYGSSVYNCDVLMTWNILIQSAPHITGLVIWDPVVHPCNRITSITGHRVWAGNQILIYKQQDTNMDHTAVTGTLRSPRSQSSLTLRQKETQTLWTWNVFVGGNSFFGAIAPNAALQMPNGWLLTQRTGLNWVAWSPKCTFKFRFKCKCLFWHLSGYNDF